MEEVVKVEIASTLISPFWLIEESKQALTSC